MEVESFTGSLVFWQPFLDLVTIGGQLVMSDLAHVKWAHFGFRESKHESFP